MAAPRSSFLNIQDSNYNNIQQIQDDAMPTIIPAKPDPNHFSDNGYIPFDNGHFHAQDRVR